jgi:hypothetical protein
MRFLYPLVQRAIECLRCVREETSFRMCNGSRFIMIICEASRVYNANSILVAFETRIYFVSCSTLTSPHEQECKLDGFSSCAKTSMDVTVLL